MIFDTHAHYDDKAFDEDREELLSSMPLKGVGLILDPGCDVISSKTALALSEKYPYVYAAVGIHPEELGEDPHSALEEIQKLAAHKKCRAIGEIGLDYYWDVSRKEEQKEIFAAILQHLLPAIREKRAAVYVNIGDYRNVWDYLCQAVPGLEALSTVRFDQWDETRAFAEGAIGGAVEGVHVFCHKDIFEAVYCTNLLMRSADVLVTKPSELAFYPIPKLFIKRIGGHERWGAIHSAEVGDGSLECEDVPHTIQMLDLFLNEDITLKAMCDAICINKTIGRYDGAYNAVKLAMSLKNR